MQVEMPGTKFSTVSSPLPSSLSLPPVSACPPAPCFLSRLEGDPLVASSTRLTRDLPRQHDRHADGDSGVERGQVKLDVTSRELLVQAPKFLLALPLQALPYATFCHARPMLQQRARPRAPVIPR